jgi:hypothetical protein
MSSAVGAANETDYEGRLGTGRHGWWSGMWEARIERAERQWKVACAQAENLESGFAPGAATESLLMATRMRRLGEEGVAPRG